MAFQWEVGRSDSSCLADELGYVDDEVTQVLANDRFAIFNCTVSELWDLVRQWAGVQRRVNEPGRSGFDRHDLEYVGYLKTFNVDLEEFPL